MNRLYAAIAGIVLFSSMLFCAEEWGEHTVQVEWDKDKAIRKALLDEKTKQNKETIDDLNAKHAADLETAKSEAGRRAVAGWLYEHSLLSDGAPLHTNSGTVPTQSPQVSDGKPQQQESGGTLEGFATGCAKDALMVLDWQQLCVRNQCEVE